MDHHIKDNFNMDKEMVMVGFSQFSKHMKDNGSLIQKMDKEKIKFIQMDKHLKELSLIINFMGKVP